ncbi:MAG TPA: hypothetical protein VJM12_19515, partial [Pyrinomonadaceae bacterium]|nr:hypothetical protein [Pyrinomonadaceae bacterium]
MTPLGVAPGRPNGSYALSDIDTVNLFNGHVNVRLPLINLAGRGSSKAQVSMTWDAPARHQVFSTTDVNGNPLYYVGPPNFWTDVNVHDGGMGVAAVGVGIGGPNFCDVGAFGYNFYIWNTTLTRMYLVEADGTQHEMRDVATGGQALPFTGNCWSTVGPSRGRIFVTTDGFGATYIADTDIRDGFVVNNEMPTGGGGWLLLKDGTRVHIAGGTMRDRNGNMFL